MEIDYNLLYQTKKMSDLEKYIDVKFDDKVLLVKAFIHSSFSPENNQNYQRLEFLGDSVLQIVVSDFMYRTMTEDKEGTMSKKRARLVSEFSLAAQIRKFNIDQYIILGKSVLNDFNDVPDSFLADIFESLVAAIYLDQGYLKAEMFIKRFLLDDINDILNNEQTIDYKTKLQEILQVNGAINIIYKTEKTDEIFEAKLLLEGVEIGNGSGKSKKIAEQQAAKCAIEKQIK